MNSKNEIEILLKVIESLYQQHPDNQRSIGFVMADICREENVFPEKVYFAFICCCLLNVGLKSSRNVLGDQEKIMPIFDLRILIV